jgi:hypothetical protein
MAINASGFSDIGDDDKHEGRTAKPRTRLLRPTKVA